MKYVNFNTEISFKRINYNIEPGVFVTCYGYEDFTNRKSLARMHKMGDYTLQFIEFGEGILNINGSVYPLKQHDLFFLPYNVPLMYQHLPQNPYKYYWISINGDKFNELLEKTVLSTETPVIHIEDFEKMLENFKALNPNENISSIKIKASFYSILTMIEKNEKHTDKKIDSKSLYNQILEFIHLNHSQPTLSVFDISNQFHINTVNLYRLFMANTNCSAKEYIIRYRMEKAKKMIAEGTPISKASDSCGSADLYYFSKAFKKYTGVSPSQYKNSLKF